MSILYAPHITSPKGGEIFNKGVITVQWDINDPPSSDEYSGINSSNVSYEIEYTDNYRGQDTVWHTAKRRIQYSTTSYEWKVGKMIKSKNVRLRMRSHTSIDGSVSDWSVISGDFSVNVFELIAPAIINPIPNRLYNDFILIILDESITRDTYNQKVRYTLEYSSVKRNIKWTTIAKDLPVGQNVIRWNTESLLPSDDYVLKLIAKNFTSSCFEKEEEIPDQIVTRFVYDIAIQQSGMFLIDTRPPSAILDLENINDGLTNQLNQIVSIFSEDDTTQVEQIQIRECNATFELGLGNIDSDAAPEEGDQCKTIEQILSESGELPDFDRIIGKPSAYATKTEWVFDDKSGVRKIEAIVTDSGGNTSIQELSKVFRPVFRSLDSIQDFVLSIQQRDNIQIKTSDNINEPPIIITEPATFEVAYLATSSGEYWTLEPFPRLIYKSSAGRAIKQLFNYNGIIYIFTYLNTSDFVDIGSIFRDDKSKPTFLFNFPNSNSIVNTVAKFQNIMYIGLSNGEIWSYNGISFTGLHTFDNPIRNIYGDETYLYIGFDNSSELSLYNGTEFFILDMQI